MNKINEMTAFVSEIFSSAQGEGIQIGRRQLFVRFCECHRKCLYCDTNVERTKTMRLERDPGSNLFSEEPNPVTVRKLLQLIDAENQPDFAHDDLFITGGEPLLQAEFLTHLLPLAQQKFQLPIHLETCGDLPEAFAQVAPWIDHVLMDIKLPSVTGEAETWDQHLAFLNAIVTNGDDATIKLVVNADTTPEDLQHATALIQTSKTQSAVVLQPMTATVHNDRVPSAKQVLTWQSQMARSLKRCVRIIPQTHTIMGLL